MKEKVRKNLIKWIIGLIIIIAVVIGVFAYIARTYDWKKNGADESTDYEGQSVTEDIDLEKYPYVRETNYKNPFKYMDVYAYPFQKSDSGEGYVMNKNLENGTDTIAKFAKEIIEKIYNTDYKQISSSKDDYEKGFIDYIDMDGIFFLEAGPGSDTGIEYPADAIEAIESYYVENMLSTEATFLTDESLVYEDGYFFCRGVLEIETFGDKNNKEKIAIPVDVILKHNMETGLFDYCGMVGIEGYDKFAIND